MATTPPTLRRLAACPDCAVQYDVAGHDAGSRFHCACGSVVTVSEARARTADVVRCSSCGGARREGATACAFCAADFTIHERDLHTVCPGCLSRIGDSARFCQGCGLAIVPQGLVGSLSERNCPTCGSEHRLFSRNVDGEITVLECDHCVGAWVGHGIFRLLEQRAEQVAPLLAQADSGGRLPPGKQLGEAFYRACVTCGKLMLRRNYGRKSGVIVDVCHEHGLWFDRGELEEILRWLREGGRERVAALDKLAPREPSAAGGTLLPSESRAGDWEEAERAVDFVMLLIDALVGFFKRR